MTNADPFRALADPTRRALLLRVAERPRPVNELAAGFGMSRPAVSKHLRILHRSGLIAYETGTEDSRQRIVRAELRALTQVQTYLEQLKTFWENRLDGLDEVLGEME